MPDGLPWYIPGMNDDHKKPLWPWIVALMIGLPILYVASFGPACWISSRAPVVVPFVHFSYRPVMWTWCVSPKGVRRLIHEYASLGKARGGWDFFLDWY